MKKAYWVVAYRKIDDTTAVQEYGKIAGPAIQAQGGKTLVRTFEVTAHESGVPQRTVVIEFESLQQALDTYESDAYQAALKVLGTAAERDFRIVEGI